MTIINIIVNYTNPTVLFQLSSTDYLQFIQLIIVITSIIKAGGCVDKHVCCDVIRREFLLHKMLVS